jgi:hypothetical protein
VSRMTMMRKESRKATRRAGKKVAPVASDARESAIRYAETTRDWAAPKVEAARDWAAPHVEPVTSRVREDVLPKVAGAVTAALAASEPVREEARTRGTAAIAALRGEIEAPKPKRHRFRKFVLLVGVIGAAVAGWRAWAGQQSSKPEPWATPLRPAGGTGAAGSGSGGGTTGSGTSTGGGSSTSSTSPSGSPAGVATAASTSGPVTDDVAGASPDEALADAAEEDAVSAERKNPGSPAGDTAAAKTTEKVPAKAAKKTAKAEGETSRSSTTRKSTS